jgi:hypothetical protein
MPRILVKGEAVLWDRGPGMGERAKGFDDAASSGRVWWSMKVRAVRPVPPEMEALGDVSWGGRMVGYGEAGVASDLHEVMLREDDTACGCGEFISDERYQ